MKNIVQHGDWMNNNIPDKSVQLIIADPPYYGIKGEFDFVWPSFRAYLRDVVRWADECKRVLADNGSLFWFGDRRNIAHTQVILDRRFTFQNHIYLKKAAASMTEQYDTLRSFYTLGFERLLFYSTQEDEYNLTGVVTAIRDYIRSEITKAKGRIVLKEINEALGTATNGGGRGIGLPVIGQIGTGYVHR